MYRVVTLAAAGLLVATAVWTGGLGPTGVLERAGGGGGDPSRDLRKICGVQKPVLTFV
jgi:hypothetical protein